MLFRGKPTTCSDSYPTQHEHCYLKRDNLETLHSTISNREYSHSVADGLHLPELMRSQTEEYRNAIHLGKNYIRTKTLTSIYHPTESRDISCKENLALTRQVSNHLDTTSTNSRESGHGLVSRFSRTTWKEKKERFLGHVSRSSTSNFIPRDANLTDKSHAEFTNSCNSISTPYNVRHLKPTKYDSVTYVTQRVPTELASDPSIHNSLHNRMDSERQAFRVDDLHFENFPFETLGTQVYDDSRPISVVGKLGARQRAVLRKKRIPCENKASSQPYNEGRMAQHKSETSLLSPASQMDSLPARKSSRTSSNNDLLFLASNKSCTRSEWDSSSPPRGSKVSNSQIKSEHKEYLYSKYHDNLIKVGEDSWPLPNSTNSSCYKVDLPDVEEEEEDFLPGVKQVTSLVQNSGSLDFDEKILRCIEDLESISEIGSPAEWDPLQIKRNSSIGESLSICSDMEIGSWESDIDWCYENELEADCDYRWTEEEAKECSVEASKTHGDMQAPQLLLQVDEPLCRKNYCPSLFVVIS
ncbi:hypothetical protein HI914_04588 [Erysiphe necator]|uniref:Putative pak-box p21-rho-binding protein n=1 Tax=Uncinula necator TaxID=52586 RepID=A0A0B1P9N8_UNCNE|nr:hypothetical protein HI914_04588 [Erysiphe necator]KHJ35397.1 putative pak-box p21-rho-binding protein [Erysiphe necator]